MNDPAPPLLDLATLTGSGRALPGEFRLRLELTPAAGAVGVPQGIVELVCVETLRLLPGRRLVARVRLADRSAVLKLFVGNGARRYCARERRGCEGIAAAGVATPARLAAVRAPAAGTIAAEGLLFQWLGGAGVLSPAPDDDLLEAATALAGLHRAGFRHRDLHLDNFLRSAAGVHLIDGDGVRKSLRVPGRRASLHDLAVLCAQRPPLADAALPRAYQAYAARRGWPSASPSEADELVRRTAAQRRARLRRYLGKAQRDCSEFLSQRSWRRYLVAVRDIWNDDLAAFAAEPERAFSQARVLKAGNSATVVRLSMGALSVVVKRYNHKNPWQALRRNLRRVPRFRRAWCNGQRLHMLDIATARPLLLVERRWGPLRGVAYLVMEDRGDDDLETLAATGTVDAAIVASVVDVLRALEQGGLMHGDTKASNFLLEDRRALLIDLDAMGEGSASSRAADRQRFVANFAGRPALAERFRQALRGAGLV